jgi:hypothetical protein
MSTEDQGEDAKPRKTLELDGNIAEWRSMTFRAVLLNEILSPLRLPFRHLGTRRSLQTSSSQR